MGTMLRRRTRGGVLLEFVLVLPLFLYMVLLSFDVGRMMVTYGALTDSAYVAARAAAQVGAPDQESAEQVAFPAFDRAVQGVPGIEDPKRSVDDTGSFCTGDANSSDLYIQVTATSELHLIAPGLESLLGITNPNASKRQLSSTAQVMCEVVRPVAGP